MNESVFILFLKVSHISMQWTSESNLQALVRYIVGAGKDFVRGSKVHSWELHKQADSREPAMLLLFPGHCLVALWAYWLQASCCRRSDVVEDHDRQES